MRIRLIVGLVTVGVTVGLVWAWRALGPASVGFAFVVVWLPMTWLGTLSRVVRPLEYESSNTRIERACIDDITQHSGRHCTGLALLRLQGQRHPRAETNAGP